MTEEKNLFVQDRCKKLWIAVIVRAILDLRSSEKEVKESAVKWFDHKINTGTGSFLWICNLYGFVPEAIIECITNKKIIRKLTIPS